MWREARRPRHQDPPSGHFLEAVLKHGTVDLFEDVPADLDDSVRLVLASRNEKAAALTLWSSSSLIAFIRGASGACPLLRR
jgi:hypothetical protein